MPNTEDKRQHGVRLPHVPRPHAFAGGKRMINLDDVGGTRRRIYLRLPFVSRVELDDLATYEVDSRRSSQSSIQTERGRNSPR
jgi:hypothetical protein